MRSTSTSSGSTQGQSTSTLSWMPNIAGVIPSNRPLSAHSRNSEGFDFDLFCFNFNFQLLRLVRQLGNLVSNNYSNINNNSNLKSSRMMIIIW